VDGLQPAVLLGAVFVGVGAVASFAIPRRLRAESPVPEQAAAGDRARAFARIDD
jgi:hypothetical protein